MKAMSECRIKDESIWKLEEILQSMESKAKSKDHIHKNLHEKIKELEDQIELKTAMPNQSEKQFSQLLDKLKGKEERRNLQYSPTYRLLSIQDCYLSLWLIYCSFFISNTDCLSMVLVLVCELQNL